MKIFLIGFMGSGKTYWGNKLSASAGIPFYDLDALIEAKAASSIQRIFSDSGEDHFRKIEQETLYQSLQLGIAIVATGGGTPCFFDNMSWMNHHGCTVYLRIPAPILAERLKHEQQFRPLLAKVEAHLLERHIEILLAQREPFYQQASIILEYHDDEAAFLEELMQLIA